MKVSQILKLVDSEIERHLSNAKSAQDERYDYEEACTHQARAGALIELRDKSKFLPNGPCFDLEGRQPAAQKYILERCCPEPNSGCWLWERSFLKVSGHGWASFRGEKWIASRLSYYAFREKPPADLFVCHKCDTPACVNPDHLFLGTNDDNMKDMARKNRGRKTGYPGSKNPMSKINDEQAMFIKNAPHSRGITASLATQFGISQSQVRAIRKGEKWKHLAALDSSNKTIENLYPMTTPIDTLIALYKEATE